MLLTDIAFPEKSVRLTEEYVYDAGYLTDGSIFFITPTNDIEKNEFLLHLANANGCEKAAIPVTGSAAVVSPDGKSIFVSSSAGEIIDLAAISQERGSSNENPQAVVKWADKAAIQDETSNSGIFSAIRGAMDVYHKNEILGVFYLDDVKKYFIDSEGPDQCALFDMTTLLKERRYLHYADYYNLDLTLEQLDIKGDRASAKIYGICDNSFGSGMAGGKSLELINKDGRWYVTGLSTYPNSQQYRDVKGKIDDIIGDISNGRLFDGILKGKEIKLGQIQFWQMSMPHYAENIDYANYCKVYLKVLEDKNEVTYKLVLDKRNYRTWTPVKLDKDYLSGL
jgi:hypothetical protein